MNDQKSIILFDGICNLCNSSVVFVLKRDRHERFKFASLQSDAAKNILLHYNWKNNEMNSILLVEDGEVYEKSTAALRISDHLGKPWCYLSYAKYLPLSWRDMLYSFIARNRYNWFGKKDSCVLMIPEYKNRFIQ